jgi:hypothetical protein
MTRKAPRPDHRPRGYGCENVRLLIGELVTGYIVLRHRLRAAVRKRWRTITSSVSGLSISETSCAKPLGLCHRVVRSATCRGLTCAGRVSGGLYRTGGEHHRLIRAQAGLCRGRRRALSAGGNKRDYGKKGGQFHISSSGRCRPTTCVDCGLAVNARAAEAHFRGHWRRGSPDIRRIYAYFH